MNRVKKSLLGSTYNPEIFFTKYSRLEGAMGQEFFSNSTLVEVGKKVATFDEMIAIIISQFESVKSFDQYDIDKKLPEKSPCCCIP